MPPPTAFWLVLIRLMLRHQARQYAAAYCLLAATTVIEMGELTPALEPEALTLRAHHKARAQTQDVRPLSGRVPRQVASMSFLTTRKIFLTSTIYVSAVKEQHKETY